MTKYFTMKSLIHFRFLLLLLFPFCAEAQQVADGLKILNPKRSPNYKLPAQFDQIKMSIKPQGVYANVDIELDVSAKNSGISHNSGDSLEIEYKFTLPAGSHIHEAWLWMNGIPVKAELYEKEKAKFIYEGLVNRNVDPLIIYKNENETYEARIFPVLGLTERKVKMSLLIPMRANKNTIELPLPVSMFRSDQSNFTPDIKVEVVHNTFWGAPDIWQQATMPNTTGNITSFNLAATPKNIGAVHCLYFSNRTADNVFIVQPETQNEGYYQLFLTPSDTPEGKHFLFALDYTNASDVSYTEILQQLKSKLLFELEDQDSFNVVYASSSNIQRASNAWLPGDAATITAFIDGLPQGLQNSPNLNYEIILNAVQFNNGMTNKGKILLITNQRTQFYSATECNYRINLMLSNMPVIFPINIVHVGTQRQQYDFYAPNGPLFNNEYFLSNLAAVTGGRYNTRLLTTIANYQSSVRSLGDAITISWNALLTKTIFDDVSYNYSGFLNSKYKVPDLPFSSERNAYIEVGKYYGSGDLSLSRNYKVDTTIYHQEYMLSPSTDTSGLTKKIWAGSYLNDLTGVNTNGYYDNLIVSESINYQVLTTHTAFLALEPDSVARMVNQNPVGINETDEKKGFALLPVPNPFSDVQRISIELSPDLYGKDWEFSVADIYGRIVCTQKGKTGSNRSLVIKWDGTSLNKGVYFVKVVIGGRHAGIKVVKI